MKMNEFKFKALVEKLISDDKNREMEKRFFEYFDNFLYQDFKDKLMNAYDNCSDTVELTITLNDSELNNIAENIAKSEMERINITQTLVVEKMISKYCELMKFRCTKGSKMMYDNTTFCTIIVDLKEKDGE